MLFMDRRGGGPARESASPVEINDPVGAAWGRSKGKPGPHTRAKFAHMRGTQSSLSSGQASFMTPPDKQMAPVPPVVQQHQAMAWNTGTSTDGRSLNILPGAPARGRIGRY
jgi:hypothetical protein